MSDERKPCVVMGQELNKKYNWLWGILFIAVFLAISKCLDVFMLSMIGPKQRQIIFFDECLWNLIHYCMAVPLIILLVYLLGKRDIFHFTWKSFGSGLAIGTVFWLFALLIGSAYFLNYITLEDSSFEWKNLFKCVFLFMGIGFTEEVLFRGIVLNLLKDMFGRKTRKDLVKAVVVSSLMFGIFHFVNLFTVSNAIFLAVIKQIIGAFGIGLCLGAIYIRTGNLWCTIFIHGFWDFAMGIPSVIFKQGSLMEDMSLDQFDGIVDEGAREAAMNVFMLTSVIVMFVMLIALPLLSWFFMRKKKIEPLLEREIVEENAME